MVNFISYNLYQVYHLKDPKSSFRCPFYAHLKIAILCKKKRRPAGRARTKLSRLLNIKRLRAGSCGRFILRTINLCPCLIKRLVKVFFTRPCYLLKVAGNFLPIYISDKLQIAFIHRSLHSRFLRL